MTATTPLKRYQSFISVHLLPRPILLNFQTHLIQFYPLCLRTVSHGHFWNLFIILYSYITQQWDAKITVSQGLVLELALYEDAKCPLSSDPGWSANEGESICAQPGRTDAATEGKCSASSPGLSRFALWVQSNPETHFSTQTVYQKQEEQSFTLAGTLWNKICICFHTNILHLLNLHLVLFLLSLIFAWGFLGVWFDVVCGFVLLFCFFGWLFFLITLLFVSLLY